MLTSFNSLQSAIVDLKEIVQRNQGINHESCRLVSQLESLVEAIQLKASKQSVADDPGAPPATTD